MNRTSEALRAALARSASARSSSPKMSDDAFRGLRDLIERASGIAFDDGSRFILERRLLSRLRALHVDDFDRYHDYVLHDARPGDGELAELLEQVAIRETYFCREPQQLEAFADEILPALARENAETRALRIWSAGCASGEEAYTVAMLVRESGLFGGWEVDVLGTDLSERALDDARAGRYRDASMRGIPDDLRDRYFVKEEESVWLLDERVRRMVRFETANLLERPADARARLFDAIFCRNVLIYFADETRRRVVASLHDRLREGGYLLLGHAESLVALNTPFRLVHLERDMVYAK